jgi:hypothetical protein
VKRLEKKTNPSRTVAGDLETRIGFLGQLENLSYSVSLNAGLELANTALDVVSFLLSHLFDKLYRASRRQPDAVD